MSSNSIPEPPAQLKAIQSFMKIASDIERVDPVVAYWVRLYSTETALTIDKSSPESQKFLGAIIVWLEAFKKENKGNEAVSNQTVGQAHVENFVVALFNKADTLDRNGTSDKTTVRMFYMAAVLFEAMAVFGPLTEEITRRAKYAKFKAAYIQKCLKTGQTPKPGPIEGSDLEDQSYPSGSTTTEQNVERGYDNKPPTDSSVTSDVGQTKQDPFILTPSSGPVKPPLTPSQNTTQPSIPNPTHSEPTKPAPAPSIGTHQNTSANNPTSDGKLHAIDGAPLNLEDVAKSQKFCKYATSALQFYDIPTAVANLEKALKILSTGQM